MTRIHVIPIVTILILFHDLSVKGQTFNLIIQCDDLCDLYIDGSIALSDLKIPTIYSVLVSTTTKVIAVTGVDFSGGEGIGINSAHIYTKIDRFGWKCINQADLQQETPNPIPTLAWAAVSYDDASWPVPKRGLNTLPIFNCAQTDCTYIRAEPDGTVYCRGYLDECRSSPCINGGTCVDGADAFTCNCLPEWNGVTCQAYDGCLSSPCINGGTCEDGVNAFTCLCPPGWTGVTCQTDINECHDVTTCGPGQCSNTDGSFTCNCRDTGYEGSLCERDVNECLDKSICSNGGFCENTNGSFTCDCSCTNTNFKGTYCEVEIDPCQSTPTAVVAMLGCMCGILLIIVIVMSVINWKLRAKVKSLERTEVYSELSGVRSAEKPPQDYASLQIPTYTNVANAQSKYTAPEDAGAEYEDFGHI